LENCERLAFGLFAQLPIGRDMHLLSSNGRCAAARAGHDGAPFGVLTQAIAHLGEEIARRVSEAKVIANISVKFGGCFTSSRVYR